MVAPFSGPFTTTENTTTRYLDKRKYRQARPYTVPLTYHLDHIVWAGNIIGTVTVIGPAGTGWFGADTMVPNQAAGYAHVNNMSYERLRGAISDSAALGQNLAEYRQSMGMMQNRLIQLAGFSRSVIRRDFLGAMDALGLETRSFNPKRRERVPKVNRGAAGTDRVITPGIMSSARKTSDVWLEFSFGWKPLIQDIYSAVDHLQNPIKSIRPKGTAWMPHSGKTEQGSQKDWYNQGWTMQSILGRKFSKQGCTVTISNPNQYLANRLGLVNPAEVAWELIPFSFVVDWFVNVGEFLSQGTDFLGLEVTNPWSVYGTTGYGLKAYYNRYSWSQQNMSRYRCAHMTRTNSLTGVSLKVRPLRLWGWQRCANAAAVLNQVLMKVR